jgi:hypothetical protein
MMRRYRLAIIFAIAVISVSILSYLTSNFDSPPASKLETPLPPVSKSENPVTSNPVTASIKSEPSIGTNLSSISYWSSQLPFLDAFKSSGAWMTQDEKVWDTKESKRLDLDENGWVKSLPRPGSGSRYTSVGTLLFRDLQGRYPGGRYVVLYEGQGTIEYGFDAKKNQAASRPGRDVIDVTPSNRGIWLKITATDPNKTSNYLRNIRVIPLDYEKTYQRQIFNPDFIEKVKAFKVFRFMDWMATNGSTQSQWSDRPTVQDARYSIKGVPVELMVELINRTNTDPWFTMPHMATDEYVRNFAQYVKDHLEPGRKVYVEYSNEVWNAKFPQNRWALQQGKAQLSGDRGSDYTKGMVWYGKRATEITQIWERVFGENKDRIIGVIAGQAANPQIAKDALSYQWTARPLSHQEYGIDAIAIAPYFGGYLGSPKHQDRLTIWTIEADGGLDLLFDELAKGGLLDDSPQGGALEQAYDWIEAHAELARQENLQLIAYEGGQHLAGIGGVENNDAITELFIKANRDPRMGTLYKEYLQKWFELGGGLFVNFSDIGQPGKWGSWGILEYVEQDSSPKYDAFLDLLDRFSSSKGHKSKQDG